MSKAGDFIKKFIDIKTLKFLAVGVLNTLVGAGIMFLLYNLLHVSYWLSSAANYVVGCIIGYFLNKYWTFGYKRRSWKTVLKYVLCVAVCYGIAYGGARPLFRLIFSSASKSVQENAAMLAGMVIYTVLNYLGQRFFAFTHRKKDGGGDGEDGVDGDLPSDNTQ